MGTRNLTVVVKDGSPKIAQYGQWDGYPEGVGSDILKFLADSTNVEALRTIADKVHFAVEGETEAIIAELAPSLVGKEWVSMEEGERLNRILPSINRDLGGKILEHLVSSDDPHSLILTNSYSFGLDSLFCEWAYVLDLDTNTLEVYVGFQKEAHTEGRWVTATTEDQRGYFPVKLIKTYSLAELPSTDDFTSELEALTADPEDEEVTV